MKVLSIFALMCCSLFFGLETSYAEIPELPQTVVKESQPSQVKPYNFSNRNDFVKMAKEELGDIRQELMEQKKRASGALKEKIQSKEAAVEKIHQKINALQAIDNEKQWAEHQAGIADDLRALKGDTKIGTPTIKKPEKNSVNDMVNKMEEEKEGRKEKSKKKEIDFEKEKEDKKIA